MMVTKYVIKMKMATRPDLDYYYCGRTKAENSPLFDYHKPKAKRYQYVEEAYRDMSILAVLTTDTLTVEKIKCKA